MKSASANEFHGKIRAFGYVVLAGIYFYFAQSISVHAANGLASGAWVPFIERSILLFLLVLGYAASTPAEIHDGIAVIGSILRRQQYRASPGN